MNEGGIIVVSLDNVVRKRKHSVQGALCSATFPLLVGFQEQANVEVQSAISRREGAESLMRNCFAFLRQHLTQAPKREVVIAFQIISQHEQHVNGIVHSCRYNYCHE